MASSSYVLPLSALEELTLSVEAISQNLPPSLELAFYIGREQRPGIEGVTIDFCGDAIAESDEEMRAALKLMDDLPVTKQALHRTTYQVCTLTELLDRFSALLDNRGRRYEANNMWTDAPMEKLIPQMHRIAQEIPAAPSHLYVLWWSPNGRKRPDMHGLQHGGKALDESVRHLAGRGAGPEALRLRYSKLQGSRQVLEGHAAGRRESGGTSGQVSIAEELRQTGDAAAQARSVRSLPHLHACATGL
jgi:hypothetical protein